MPTKRTTLASIAQALEISVSTVSKALSNSPEIGVETKKRVLEYAKANNYTPNSFASSFRKGTTSTIGLIIPNILNPFYAKVLIGVESYLDDNGYKLITSISNDFIEKETKNLSVMSSGFVDGLIICVSKEAVEKKEYAHIKQLIDNGTPVVLFDRICDELICDKVITDDYQAAFDATEYLIKERNCKHIVITCKTNTLQHLDLRRQGFEKAIEKYKSDVKCKVIIDDRSKGLKQKLAALLKSDPTIDGVFGLNEKSVLNAIVLTNKLQKKNCKISIAGFCNDLQSKYDSSLIVINQNAKEIGKETAKLLLERIKSKDNTTFQTKTIAVDL
ncbi:LacI family transcriptional regulator [Lacinutrix sp. C3R15]|uniref:LacI family DNA-binding transcriptional regulator n=1 Tax=Flavobacteriaceae TaxID=49546 RepID=UPI001C0A568E|nr:MULTISPECIES: LacI family DNA-binding transcriptional regulator [Flavobacteriaceae]MBU2939104.1 LacI family transcriptional regulator [Lacinutrix sp. C3R15]MDO6622419.1 LacI family DNA-binding transcriptional regulator [Oceanihabitans sp. 1_MG-2023]